MKPAGALRKLIRACIDDERTLRHECKFLDLGRAEALTRMAGERVQFVADLERLGVGAVSHDGSWAELLREAGRAVWVVAAGRNNGDAITTCRHSRARTEARYDEVLQGSWPVEMQHLLATQRRRIQDGADLLIKLQF